MPTIYYILAPHLVQHMHGPLLSAFGVLKQRMLKINNNTLGQMHSNSIPARKACACEASVC